MSKKRINASELSTAELRELIKQRDINERNERLRAREMYELKRDNLVNALFEEAKGIADSLKLFKLKAFQKMEAFRELAKEYSDIRSNSKGGFSLRSADGNHKIALNHAAVNEWDERGNNAEQLILEFLKDTVKKRDLATYELITTLLTRNAKSGDFNPASINALLKIEDKFTDERWKRAMTLFKEAYILREVAWSISFFEKDALGKDRELPLSFAAVQVAMPDINQVKKEENLESN